MNIRRFLAIGGFVALVGLAGFALTHRDHRQSTAGLQVTASFYPLYEFAKHVGGPYVSVQNITPAGAEPHDYEPSPQAVITAQKSAVFIYNGGTLEPWADKFLKDYTHTVVKSSEHIALQRGTDEDNHSIADPHFWLDPVLAQQIVNNIRDGLVRADPAHANQYTKNAAAYNKQLQQLDHDFTSGLSQCKSDTVITAHAAFGYLAHRYNLHVEAISGISPDQEPSPAKLAEISQLARAKDIRYIFFESLVSPRLADTIAQEVGAKTLVFDPLEGLTNEDQQHDKNYLSVQRENLANLRTALACR